MGHLYPSLVLRLKDYHERGEEKNARARESGEIFGELSSDLALTVELIISQQPCRGPGLTLQTFQSGQKKSS